MTALDTLILDYIAIGAYWAFNATVVFFMVMMIISGMLHAIWGILEGVDNRVFYPEWEYDKKTIVRRNSTLLIKKSRGYVPV